MVQLSSYAIFYSSNVFLQHINTLVNSVFYAESIFEGGDVTFAAVSKKLLETQHTYKETSGGWRDLHRNTLIKRSNNDKIAKSRLIRAANLSI
jgi:hypothetical protein